MKKFILVALAALFVCSAVDAQILRADELEKYAKEKYIPVGHAAMRNVLWSNPWNNGL